MNYINGLRIFFFVSVFNNLVLTVSNSIDVKQKLKWIHEGKNTNVDKLKDTEKAISNQNIGWILVPVALDRRKRSIDDKKSNLKRLSHSVHVQSDIRYRYATTLVTSEVHNPETRSREIFMTVILPDTAFISRFAIELGGQLFVAYVREKENAWREYQEAVSKGKTAGHVGISARHSNQFRVSVNTEAKSRVTFYLLYEELLQRKRSIYEHVINLTPRQKLKDFGIDIQIMENRPIKDLTVPNLKRKGVFLNESSEALEGAQILKDPSHPGTARISYRPLHMDKLQALLKSNHALQFSVKYDVDRDSGQKDINHKNYQGIGGEIQVVDGYFVHFVAPENLPPMAKHVIFVLDVSGSMEGKKLVQLRNAMKTILGELRTIDFFSIIEFSDNVTEWRKEATAVNDIAIREAKNFVDEIKASGGTNIHAGLMSGLSKIKKGGPVGAKTEVQPMIIFLTDGHATVGVQDHNTILKEVREFNEGNAPIFGLSFGRFADFSLMKTLSLQNYAFTRKIYIAADAALQLEGFYKEVSSPLLRNIQFKYQDDEILTNSLTSTNFHTYYQGSELVVAGKLPAHPVDIQSDAAGMPTGTQNDLIKYEIVATQATGGYHIDGQYNTSAKAEFYPQTITETVFDVLPRVRESVNGVNFLERLWAYLTIRDLLERVAKGDLNSCDIKNNEDNDVTNNVRKKRKVGFMNDDEDYDYEGSGDDDEYYYVEENNTKEPETEVEQILDEVGDEDLVICDNIERALYLSLKYEFVTPLTSLVVVSPDQDPKEGDLSEVEGQQKRRHTINLINGSPKCKQTADKILSFVFLLCLSMNFYL